MSNIPNGVIFIWAGNHADIPAGWERVTALDGKYPKGAADGVDPNGTGGSATHTHTLSSHTHTMVAHSHTGTVGPATSGIGTGGGTGNAGQNHTHTATIPDSIGGSLTGGSGTYSEILNDPPYYTVIFIRPTNPVKYLPNLAIYLYENTDSKSGHYVCDGNNSTPNLANKYLKGAETGANAGSTGGSVTNIHSLIHTHTIANHSHAMTTGYPSIQVASDSPTGQTVGYSHTHSQTITGKDNISETAPQIVGSEVVEPAYTKLLAVQNRTGHGDARIGMIGMWLGTLSSIPSNYELTATNMKGRHLKLTATASEIGNTGGSNTHTHASKSHTHVSMGHSHSATLYHPSNTGDEKSSASPTRATAPTDTHSFSTSIAYPTYSSDSTESGLSSNEPEYRTVAFIKLKSLQHSSFMFI